MVYHFTTTGVEQNCSSIQNVQRSRTDCLNRLNVPSKYIFCGIDPNKDAYSILSKQNFVLDDIIWMPAYLCNRKLEPSLYTEDMFKKDYCIDNDFTFDSNTGRYNHKNNIVAYALILNEDKNIMFVDTYVNNYHSCRDCYMGEKMFYSERFTKEHHCSTRSFYDNDNVNIYTYINHGKADCNSYIYNGNVYMSSAHMIRAFLKKIGFTKSDVVIIDGVFDCHVISSCFRPATTMLQLQSHHHIEGESTEDVVIYSGYGSYFYKRYDIDYVIAATKEQGTDLEKHFKMTFGSDYPKIRVIPVGCADSIKKSDYRKPHSFVTAAKFSHVKRMDLVIKAIIVAHNIYPDITLDIYGVGSWDKYFRKIVSDANAESYIKFNGFCDMTNVYQDYDVHIMATSSEGFSLVTMESVMAGCAQIGFKNVQYSTNEFIFDGKNGFTADLQLGYTDEDRVASLSRAIIKYCNVKNTKSFHDKSYSHAKNYLTEEVTKKWEKLLLEVNNQILTN